jgi:transcriptional regulator with XRE-family HTH domain
MAARRRRGRPLLGCRTLAEYIRESGETQVELARRVGITQAQISRIAKGLLVPRPMVAQRIAECTGIPLDSFTRCYLARRAMDAAGLDR